MSSDQKEPSAAEALRTFTGVRRKFLLALLAPAQFLGEEELRLLLTRLVFLRVLVLSTFLGTAAIRLIGAGQNQTLVKVCLFIGMTFLLSVVNALAVKKTRNLVSLGYVQVLGDVVLVTCAIYLSASALSYLLYLLVILAGALAFGKHGSIIVASFSGLSYAVLESGLLPGSSNYLSASPQDILLVYISFLAIGLVSAYLAAQAQRWNLLATEHAEHLDVLAKKQELLLNDISEGIATLHADGTVLGLNLSAKRILNVPENWAPGTKRRSLRGLFEQFGFTFEQDTFDLQSGTTGELSLRRGETELHLSYVVKAIPTPAASDLPSQLVFFSDVSRVKDMEERLRLHERMTQLLAEQGASTRPALSASDFSMVGDCEVMRQIFTLVEKVAQSDASVLVSGESGTGKELIARAIHNRGERRSKPFVAINCGAIPENLIESELFGHKKGSFTGAVTDNPGLFRQANGGTVFLDEIGELPLPLQTKLLRVLQERRVRAVGDVHDTPVDVRIIAATNRELRKEIQIGAFREDLYYRLNVVNVPVPPLRERKEDLPLLIRHFIEKYSTTDNELARISPEALQLLSNYPFPGNIRELENMIERALVLGGTAILPEHLPEDLRRSSIDLQIGGGDKPKETKILILPLDLESELSRIEKNLLLSALEQTGGLKKQAAELLGLNFRSFRYRLKKYGMGEGSGETGDGAE